MKFPFFSFTSSFDKRIKSLFEDDRFVSRDDLYYLNTLYRSICNVKNDYVVSTTPFSGDKEEELVEQEISSELYRQYQNRLDRRENPLNLCSRPELRKHVSRSEIELYNTYDVQPDFVVHHSQKDFENQLIAGEIKRQSSLNVDNTARDINKLLIYINPTIWGGHQYKYPVFVIFNSDKKMFTHSMMNFLRNNRKLEFIDVDASIICMSLKDYLHDNVDQIKKIICFFYIKQDEVDLYNLYDIIKGELNE